MSVRFTQLDYVNIEIARGRLGAGLYCPRGYDTVNGGKCEGVAQSDNSRPMIRIKGMLFDSHPTNINEIPADCPFGLRK